MLQECVTYPVVSQSVLQERDGAYHCVAGTGRGGGGARARAEGEARARARAGVVGGGAVGQLARVCALRPLRGTGGGDLRAARHAAARAHGRRRPRALLPGLLPWRGAPPTRGSAQMIPEPRAPGLGGLLGDLHTLMSMRGSAPLTQRAWRMRGHGQRGHTGLMLRPVTCAQTASSQVDSGLVRAVRCACACGSATAAAHVARRRSSMRARPRARSRWAAGRGGTPGARRCVQSGSGLFRSPGIHAALCCEAV